MRVFVRVFYLLIYVLGLISINKLKFEAQQSLVTQPEKLTILGSDLGNGKYLCDEHEYVVLVVTSIYVLYLLLVIIKQALLSLGTVGQYRLSRIFFYYTLCVAITDY
jgi:hypothetical protein